MDSLEQLLENNRAWSEKIRQDDPQFFPTLSRQQAPKYLWIGCSDSRVPANQVCGLLPGEVFVHRNVANIVVHSDLNCLSVMQYAIDALKVEHILVVGHYGCGGVRAALGDQKLGLIDNWLRHVQDVIAKHRPYLECMADGPERSDRLCELNVIAQTLNVAQTSIVQEAWQRGQSLAVHGWIYGLEDGLIRQLGLDLSSPEDVRAALAENWEKRGPRPARS